LFGLWRLSRRHFRRRNFGVNDINCFCVVACANFFRSGFLRACNFLGTCNFFRAGNFLRASNFFRRSFFNWLVRNFFWLRIANKTFTLGTRTNAIGLSVNNCRRWTFYANAKFSAEVNDLGVGHSEFFSDLVNAFGFWQSV
jgi:hypothetical protein